MAEPTGASQSVFSGSISDLKKKKVPPCGAASPIAIRRAARPPPARPRRTLEARRKFGAPDAAAARGRGRRTRARAAAAAARGAGSPRVSGWYDVAPPPPRSNRPRARRRHPIIQFCWGQEPHWMFVFILSHLLFWYRGGVIHGFKFENLYSDDKFNHDGGIPSGPSGPASSPSRSCSCAA